MKIAFVGKGGSGKTTLSALFTQYVKQTVNPVLAIDADLNMHLAELIGFKNPNKKLHLSHPDATKEIKVYLKGKNHRIKELAHFRKTTPPTRDSNIMKLDSNNPILNKFAQNKDKVYTMTVGTYSTEELGTSCYHNNLAVLENILSHMDEEKGIVVVDMVAGVDAFANTLHAQFDLLVLVVEPTRRGVEVYKQYQELARSGNVLDSLVVIGNKIQDAGDEKFISDSINSEHLLGIFKKSDYLRQKDQYGGELDITNLEEENTLLLETIRKKLISLQVDKNARLQKLCDLHKKYVAQAFISERFGDLSDQIDYSFK